MCDSPAIQGSYKLRAKRTGLKKAPEIGPALRDFSRQFVELSPDLGPEEPTNETETERERHYGRNESAATPKP